MSSHYPDAMRVLKEEVKLAEHTLASARETGLAAGEFGANLWTYRGLNLHFVHIASDCAAPLDSVAGLLARCFVASVIRKKRKATTVAAHLAGFRYLAAAVKSPAEWSDLTMARLNSAVKLIHAGKNKVNKKSTVYHRANGISRFVEYLNRVGHKIDGKMMRFGQRVIRWAHGIPNPIGVALDRSSAEHVERRERLYKQDVALALGRARHKVWVQPELELAPGSDLIRLESLVFAMGLGCRIGEICSLPVNALESDPETGACHLRVATEKGALPAAIGVPDGWRPSFERAYAYLLEACAPARRRAKEIEDRGFQFVYESLSTTRAKSSLTHPQEMQLKVTGLAPDRHYFISELTSSFDLTHKEFTAGGRFHQCLIHLPRPVSALIAVWIDERIQLWDWHKFATLRFGRDLRLTLDDVTALAGAARSCGSKATWFADDLRAFLKDVIKGEGHLDCSVRPSQAALAKVVKQWRPLKAQMLSNSSSGKSCVVCMEAFISALAKRYAAALNRHFEEVLDPEEGMVGGGFESVHVRPGVPSKLSRHLIVVWEGQFSNRKTMGVLPQPITRSEYYNYLALNGQKTTVFERLDIRDANGEVATLRPHDLRRWLTTAMLRSGATEAAVDVWMGREVGQTRQYDYRTLKELAEYARPRYLQESVPDDYLGKRVREWRSEGLTEQEIETLVVTKLSVLHYTPYGTCSQNLYLSPCQKGLMCLRGFGTDTICKYFHVDVEDTEAKAAIEALRDRYAKQLAIVNRNLAALTEVFEEELNQSEPLDQHLKFMIDVVRGCNEALAVYDRAGG